MARLTSQIGLVLLTQCFLITSIYSQQTDILTDAALSEKIYLQTDGEVYTSDQTIWFKTIITNAIDHTPTMLSGVLYIELINSKEEVVRRKVLKINQGTASGSFELKDTYEEGRYLLRAYTEWSKNFGSDFYHESYLYIFPPDDKVETLPPAINNVRLDRRNKGLRLQASIDPISLDSLHEKRLTVYVTVDGKKDSLTLKKSRKLGYELDYQLPDQSDVATIKIKTSNDILDAKTILVNEDAMDLQFFPESGSLVYGLISKVGFKAVSPDGKGKQVTGSIVNEKGEELTTFESNDLGMGALILQPKQGETYYAKVASTKNDNLDVLYPLPEVNPEGTVMSIKRSTQGVSVRVSSNNMKSDLVYIEVSRRGVSYFNVQGKLNEQGQLLFNFNTEQLPEGVLAFTLRDKSNQPLATRLYFNEKLSERLNVAIASDKETYAQRDKARLKAKVTDNEGQAVDAKLSVLVLNKEQLGDLQQKRENILSYFLMNSELKGHIENPGHYFRPENEHRLKDLDVLMLTQGWSTYKYTELSLPEEQLYQPELSLTVSGSVTGLISQRKTRKGIDLTMTTFYDPPTIDTQTTDDLGRFSFNVSDAFGESMPVLIQTKRKGKNTDFTINLDEKLSPNILFNHEVSIQQVDSIIFDLVEKHQERKLVDDAYDFSTRVRDLGEVIVEDYELTPQREQMMEEYGEPSEVIEGDELRKYEPKWSTGLYSAIKVKYSKELRDINFRLWVVDGIPVVAERYGLLSRMPINEIKSFEIIMNPKGFRKLFTKVFDPSFLIYLRPPPYAIISIYTYAGNGLSLKTYKGIFHGTVPVFSFEREFYAPKYEKLTDQDWIKPDYRALVHWLPDAVTDEKGVVETEFYNADNLGEMLVVVEAISSDGQIGYQEMEFRVEKRKR